MDLPIYVINLPASTERRRAMEEQLRRVGATAQFFPAIDGRQIRTGLSPELCASDLTDGEIGCYLSHVALWEKVATSLAKGAVILEDDVTLTDDFLAVCQELGSVPLRYDLVRLGSLRHTKGRKLLDLANGRSILLPAEASDGTQGYLVTRAGAERLLKLLAEPRAPIDRELNLYWEHRLNVLLLAPGIVEHDTTMPSTIAPTGRAAIRTSLPLIPRVIRSIRKRFRMHLILRSVTRES